MSSEQASHSFLLFFVSTNNDNRYIKYMSIYFDIDFVTAYSFEFVCRSRKAKSLGRQYQDMDSLILMPGFIPTSIVLLVSFFVGIARTRRHCKKKTLATRQSQPLFVESKRWRQLVRT